MTKRAMMGTSTVLIILIVSIVSVLVTWIGSLLKSPSDTFVDKAQWLSHDSVN